VEKSTFRVLFGVFSPRPCLFGTRLFGPACFRISAQVPLSILRQKQRSGRCKMHANIARSASLVGFVSQDGLHPIAQGPAHLHAHSGGPTRRRPCFQRLSVEGITNYYLGLGGHESQTSTLFRRARQARTSVRHRQSFTHGRRGVISSTTGCPSGAERGCIPATFSTEAGRL